MNIKTFLATLVVCTLAIPVTSTASEEEFVPWQSVSIKSPELPRVGIVTIEATVQAGVYQKLSVGVFERTHTLTAADLKRLEGFPLSSLTPTQEAGYASLGGHTLHLKFSRTYYDEAKKQTEREAIVISIPLDAAPRINGPKPR